MSHLTRKAIALFFTLAFVLVSSPILASAASPYKDVKTNHSAYSAIEWAYQQGITKNYTNGTFEPDRTITEAQFVDMLIRLDCSAADSFKTSIANNYRYLQNKNIPVNGANNMTARNLPITKGQVARIAAAFQGVDLSETRAVQYLYKNDLANGATGKNDYQDYNADLSMTRADAVVFLQRLSEKGDCTMVGLDYRATGSDDKTITLPPNFLGTGSSLAFELPTVTTQPPVITQPTIPPPVVDNAPINIDVDKPTLIANGLDSTFVTVSLNGCTKDGAIDYSDSLPFTVKSALGAQIDSGQTTIIQWKYDLAEGIKKANEAETKLTAARNAVINADATLKDWQSMLGPAVDPKIIQEIIKAQDRLADARILETTAETEAIAARTYLAAAQAEVNNSRPSSVNTVNRTDGPDMIVRVTAPKSNQYRTDTLTFELGQSNINCANKTITVNLDYAPQAELRLEVVSGNTTAFNGILPADGTTAFLRATVVSPGGAVIQGYNGSVRFRSAQGINLSDEYVRFTNGVAVTTITSPKTTYSIADEITAEFDIVDSRYKDQIASIVNTTHRIKILHEPTLQADKTCSLTVPEVAFIIDSSGSMRSSDPSRARVTKSRELMLALNASKNIAAKFNSSGQLLHPNADSAATVGPKINNVDQSGGTNILGGLKTAFNNFAPGNTPKVAILLTDGKSNAKQTLSIIADAKQKNIKIYTIGLGKKNQLNEAVLQQLAKDTGGHYYHVAESSELGAAYQSILSAITCDTPPGPTCSLSSEIFKSPTLKTVGNEFFMNTYINDNCGQVTRVVLRFNSSEGDIDYELANRNRAQGYFALQKGTNEINNFHLLQDGVFLAYNAKGELIGEKRVQMIR